MDAIAPAWRALEIRAADPLTYFQSFAWCRAWCAFHIPETVAAGASAGPAIRICTVWQDDRLVMVWPLMAIGNRFAVRRILSMGEPHSQYGNLIVDPQFRSSGQFGRAIEACWQSLRARDGAHLLIVDNVPDAAFSGEGGGLHNAPASGPPGLAPVPAGLSAAFDLTAFERFADYRASLKSSTRRARNKRRNKLAALGELDYVVRGPDDSGYADLVRKGIAMKRRWLTETGRATRALNLPNIEAFLSALTNEPDGTAGAVVAALMLDGEAIAVEIGFLWHRRFYSWLGSFDWALRDYSPGKVQLEEAIGWCIENGVTHYDLLGDPTTYKSDWSNGAAPILSWRAAPTLRGWAYVNLWHDRLRPAAKKAFEAMPCALKARLIPIAERRSVPEGMAGACAGRGARNGAADYHRDDRQVLACARTVADPPGR